MKTFISPIPAKGTETKQVGGTMMKTGGFHLTNPRQGDWNTWFFVPIYRWVCLSSHQSPPRGLKHRVKSLYSMQPESFISPIPAKGTETPQPSRFEIKQPLLSSHQSPPRGLKQFLFCRCADGMGLSSHQSPPRGLKLDATTLITPQLNSFISPIPAKGTETC